MLTFFTMAIDKSLQPLNGWATGMEKRATDKRGCIHSLGTNQKRKLGPLSSHLKNMNARRDKYNYHVDIRLVLM